MAQKLKLEVVLQALNTKQQRLFRFSPASGVRAV